MQLSDIVKWRKRVYTVGDIGYVDYKWWTNLAEMWIQDPKNTIRKTYTANQPGKHTLSIKFDSKGKWRAYIKLPGHPRYYDLTTVKPKKVSLSVETIPSNAKVWIVETGETKTSPCSFTLTPGTYTVKASKTGYKVATRKVSLSTDSKIVIQLQRPSPPKYPKAKIITATYPKRWSTPTTLLVTVSVKNIGSAKGKLYVRVVDRDFVGPIHPDTGWSETSPVSVNQVAFARATFAVPGALGSGKDFHGQIQVGHKEDHHIVDQYQDFTVSYVPPPECIEDETKCVDYNLYKCVKGKWTLVETNSTRCGYQPPTSQVTVHGTIFETRGGQTIAPLPYAEISATNTKTNISYKTESKKDGTWSMKLQPGFYDSIAAKKGYCSFTDYYVNLTQPGSYNMLPYPLELKTNVELKWSTVKPVFSKTFTFNKPYYADRLTGKIKVAPTGTLWSNFDIWMHTKGRKERVEHQSYFISTPVENPRKITFRPTMVEGVTFWAGGGWLDKATNPGLLGVNFKLVKQYPCG